MKQFSKLSLCLIAIYFLTGCASGYKPLNPESMAFVSTVEEEGVTLKYKYDVLDKKYAKKEEKKGIRLVALQITNNSGADMMFGRDIKLMYSNNKEIVPVEKEVVFKTLRQRPATYLLYLLLTPLNFFTYNGNGEVSNSIPIGLIIGPGVTAGNMITAGSANKKFKKDLLIYDINGTVIQQGESRYGLVALRSDSYEALQLIVFKKGDL